MVRRRYNADSNKAPRIIALVLLGLFVLIQYPLWYGKGSERNLHELRIELAVQRQNNDKMRAELEKMQAEANSLRQGQEALESRARESMNMIRENEVLFRLSESN